MMRSVFVLGFLLGLAGLSFAQEPTAFTDAQLVARALDDDLVATVRTAALVQLQQRGALDTKTVVAALASPSAAVADSAAAIVRHGWWTMPEDLPAALESAPAAALVLGRELAIAPRSSFVALAEQELRDDSLKPDDRCLWLAARGTPLSMKEGTLVLSVLAAGEAGDGCHAAFAVLPSLVADALVARLHGLLLQGKANVSTVTPWFDRMSDEGRARLLSLAVTLPDEPAAQICQYVIERAPAIYEQRAAAALDGVVPIERLWLQRAAPLLDRPERVERVLTVLADEAAAPTLRRAAFEVLANAKVVDARVLDYAEDIGHGELRPLHRLLDVAAERIPVDRLLEWLQSSPEFSTPTLAALGRRPALEAPLVAALFAPIADAGCVSGLWCERAAYVLALRAPLPDLQRMWPLLRTTPDFAALVEMLSKRREPAARELLRGELQAAALPGLAADVRSQQLAAVRLALVTLGDTGQLAQLVAQGPTLPPPFVRRCTVLGQPLDVGLARSLIAAARQADEKLASELLAWAASCPASELAPLWQDVYDTADSFEAQEIALRALCAGGHRPQLVERLRAAIASGAWDDELDTLRFEVVATVASPPSAADLRLLAELVLLAPLAEPQAERERAERWPDGTHGFPFVAAVAQALRGAEPAAVRSAFDEVVGVWKAHAQRAALSRQGLLVLWRSLEVARDVQTAVATSTCVCFDALPSGDDAVGAGPAAWFTMLREEAAGDYAAAARAARAAIEHLLFDSHRRRECRLFLGERDPIGQDDPWAALAAAPVWLEARASGRITEQLNLALDLVGHDADLRARLERATKTPR